MSWDDAINEIGDKMLNIREESGPDSVYWLGSAKHNNEQAYLFRKFAASGARTTSTTRRVSVTRPRSRVLPTPGATAR
jgi:predicted molibdopterin-dependent oxidoreductase YjgC